MELNIALTYSDVFDGPVPELEELLKDVPSSQVVIMLSIVNAQIYLEDGAHFKLLKLLLQNQPPLVVESILRKILNVQSARPGQQLAIFSIQYGLEFLHYELCHYRTGQIHENPENELAFFKAYLIVAKRVNERESEKIIAAFKSNDALQQQLWPIMIDQYVVNQPSNPVFDIPKSIALFNFFEKSTKYSAYVKTFLDVQQKAASWNYVLDLVSIISEGWKALKNDSRSLYPFMVRIEQGYRSFFDNLTIDHLVYSEKYRNNKISYSGIKERPLFSGIDADTRLILNWNFLAAKVYEALSFDFYRLSGINKEFKDFISFKKFVSEEFVEKTLFRKVLREMFVGIHSVINVESHIPGFPDAYVRIGKYVFLFEIKDAFFPSDAIDARSFNRIKEAIDSKYNNDKKGTGQLVKQLAHLKEGSFEERTFEQLMIKRKNLVIYPVIVYTDRHFGMPGFNKYLNHAITDKITNANLTNVFGVVKPLTFIDFSFLINNIDILKNRNTSFKVMIDAYHDYSHTAARKFKRNRTEQNSFAINENFETVSARKFINRKSTSDRGYIEDIVRILGLTELL